jgi:hypothetical protein
LPADLAVGRLRWDSASSLASCEQPNPQ